jgi:hypothetical protein
MTRHLQSAWISAFVFAGLAIVSAAGGAKAQSAPGDATAPAVTYASQGWSDADRDIFYTTSQGSHLMPYAWFKALRRLDVDQPFIADALQRYGYLRNDRPNELVGLPVGFVVDGTLQSGQVGLTCAACHTAQLEYQKNGVTHALRLDGAPANADSQQFLTDLKAASRATSAEPERFETFAKAVLGTGYSPIESARLKIDFDAWVKQFGDFMDSSLPESEWGPGRLDAFGMIFNRVAGRDLGVSGNFASANAPVSYPFLWNAPRQDHTQWNGAVPNGLYIQGLARNTGEVFGVFADFRPRIVIPGTKLIPALIGYRSNSASFAGLQTLEEKIAALRPPAWPRDLFPLDDELAAKGKPLFEKYCGECHDERASPDVVRAWRTPVVAVGTDPKMQMNAQREGDPGLYAGSLLPPPAIGTRFAKPARIGDILGGSVVGSLLDEAFLPIVTPGKLRESGVWRALGMDLRSLAPGKTLNDLLHPDPGLLRQLRSAIRTHLENLYGKSPTSDVGAAYEARVLHGIWATAPYLHNGSVPNLWELLMPAKQRQGSFMVGSRVFDPKNVGYVTEASPFKNGMFTADPTNTNGNGNQGHEFGSDLAPDDKWAIIEYLKTL